MNNQFEKESYDLIYTNSEIYKKHYKDITYYTVWKYITEKLSKNDKLLDLGCGPGHLANMFYDNGFKTYIGIDFSKVAIEMAKIKVPTYTFIEADITDIDYNQYKDFNFICIETFEHLENDLELIEKLPQNNYIIFSVPNYISANHYRTYDNEDFIKTYYKDVLNIVTIKSFLTGLKDNKIFVNQAIIK